MSSIRRIASLRRLVLVTTLTKQSVRSILELTRPASGNLGNPFIPIRACVVDTLPAGPHFEAVILMERRVMEKIIPSLDLRPKNQIPNPNVKNQGKAANKAEEKLYPQKFEPVKPSPTFKKNFAPPNKNNLENLQENRNKFAVKRSHSPEIIEEIPTKQLKKPIALDVKPDTAKAKQPVPKPKVWDDPTTKRSFDDPPAKPRSFDDLPPRQKPWEESPAKRKTWEEAPSKKKPWEDQPLKENPWEEPTQRHKPWEKPPQAKTWETQKKPQWKEEESPIFKVNPLHEKKSREPQDLRERLSANRAESSSSRPDPASKLNLQMNLQKVKESHRLMAHAKEKVNASSAPLDEDTAKQLENMLDKVLEQTTKIHNQVSVWDRIAPAPENDKSGLSDGNTSDGYIFDDRGLLDRKPRKFRPPSPTPAGPKKYTNIPPLEPNLVMPAEFASSSTASAASKFNKKKYRGQYRQHLLEKMNKMKAELAQKRTKSYSERSVSPYNRSMSPGISVLGKISPKRSVSPTRSTSPRRREVFRRSPAKYSPGRPTSSARHSPRRSPIRLSPGRHSPMRNSPGRHSPRRSPSRHSRSFYSPHGVRQDPRQGSLKQSISPKRSYSPIARSISPTRREIRRVHSPPRHHSPRHSPVRRHSPRRVSPYSRVSPRRGSPRYLSPTPRVLSPRRPLSPVLMRLSPPRRAKTPPRATPPARYD